MKNFIIFLYLSIFNFAYSQSFEDIFKLEFKNSYSQSLDIKLDKNNNIYCSGIYSEKMDCDPSDKVNIIESKLYHYNYFLIKLDSNKKILWTKNYSFNTNVLEQQERPFSFDIDTNNNVYIATSFFDTLKLKHNSKDTFLVSESNSGNGIILKLDQNGHETMINHFRSNGLVMLNKVMVKKNQDIMLFGIFEDSMRVDMEDDVKNVSIVSNSFSNIFFIEMNTKGYFNYLKYIESNYYCYFENATFDNSNNTIFTGVFSHLIDLDPSKNTKMEKYPNGIFIVKINPSGDLIWENAIDVKYFGDKIFALQTDSDANIYFSGDFTNSVDLDITHLNQKAKYKIGNNYSHSDCILFKWDSSGNYKWSNRLIMDNSLYFQKNKPFIAIDTKIHLISDFHTKIQINNIFFHSITRTGLYSCFDLDGNYEKGAMIHGNGILYSSSIVSNNKNLYWLGDFKNEIDFDPSNKKHEVLAVGEPSIFVLKLNNDYIPNNEIDTGINMQIYNENDFDIKIYPNPTKNILKYSFSIKNKISEIQIHDLNGKLVYSEKNGFNGEIDISNLQNANYFITLIFDDRTIKKSINILN